MIALLLAAAQPAAAAPAPAASDSHAAAERAFLAALPDAGDPEPAPEIDAERLARLVARHPGREEDARAALRVGAECRQATVAAQAHAQLAATARALPEETLVRLTRFYTGPDYRRFTVLSEIAQPSDAEAAELQAIVTRNALMAFQAETRRQMQKLWEQDDFMPALAQCDGREDQALAARGLAEAGE